MEIILKDVRCACEYNGSEARIKCLISAYKNLMLFRRRPLTNVQLETLYSTNNLSEFKLSSLIFDTATEAFAESQILYTFVELHAKTHPGFLIDGPDIGDIRLKTNFFSST
ncbi:OrNV gp094-like protein [Mauternbach virus]|uniref:OrNV gp094-like protein n=1 Tax=Mauternbach virus TaxID=2486603 RepID=A0A3G3E6A4_9VIRU|nr:OrNV gp094-like protein [Mauternbach virus]AYP97977.1 OrNV gp094-like protein [Mauternbach virus]